jgi:hypothetical protein
MTDNRPAPVSAAELRMTILKKELEEAEKQARQKAKAEEGLRAFTDSFLNDHVSEDELALVRKLVMNAVNNGKFEAMIYSFPSDLCTDSGRAINNRLPHWPETLQGKAKELYDRYLEAVKPQGFRLKATIINFPNGMPGDVGLFLNWAPENAA